MATANERGAASERATDAFPRWVWLAGAGGLLVLGWVFILMVNSFHLTAPVVIVCLGYLAGVSSVYALFRAGAAAATAGEDDGDAASWGRPIGVRAELEREKKALLKAIKEAEFDLQMGKLSRLDAEAMIAAFRAQAIDVIRELDDKDGGDASVREQIEREVRARLAVAKAKKAADGDRRPGKKGKKQQAEAAAAQARDAVAMAEAAAAQARDAVAVAEAAEAKAEVAAEQAEAAEARAEVAAEQADAAEARAEVAAEQAEQASAKAADVAAEVADVAAAEQDRPDAAKEATS